MKNRLWAIIALPLSVAGCVNPAINGIRDTKALPAYAAPDKPHKTVVPQNEPDSYRAGDSGRTYSLTLKNADLRDVLLLLSRESGVTIVAERGLRGTVQIDARNKKLGEMLYTILKPLGYTASLENGIILVGRPKLNTRTFRVNYLKDRRNSTSNMNVSGFAAGSVSVSTEGKSDFWGALENSLEMLVFGTSGKGKRDAGGYIRGEEEKIPAADSKIATVAPARAKSPAQGVNIDRNFERDETIMSTHPNIDNDDPQLQGSQIYQNRLKQLVVNELAGIIQVTDHAENLDRIAAFLADVEEGSKRQVLIQAHIMEVSLKDSFSMGIDWKYIIDKASNLTVAQALAPGSNVFRLSAAGSDFAVLLDAMKEQGNVNMLSSPKITALNNQKAVIKLTTKQVSWVSSKTTQNNAIGGQDTYTTTPQVDEVGIFLDVTPQIGHDNSITMQIHPSVSEIKEISTSPDKTSTKPVIDIREIDTMVDARAGETIVIAGLISDKLNETKRSVPLLGDIPYLGALFSYSKQERAKTELVIMMTPYILNAKSIEEIRVEHERRIQNLGGDFHLINNLGSMITEKSSRDRIMLNQPHRVHPMVANKDTPTQKKSAAAPPRPQPQPQPEPEPQLATSPQIITVTPPETVRRLEQQQTQIEQLKNEVATAQDRLARERGEFEKLASKTAREGQTINIAIEQATKNRQTAAATLEPVPRTVAIEPEPKTLTATVQTTSATSDREQTIYRSAVTAYKIGDCAESIKTFDAFLKLYPRSPFSQDALYYRRDCAERLK